MVHNAVDELFKRMAGDKLRVVAGTAAGLEQTGKSPDRAAADALELHNLAGAVKCKKKKKS